MTSLDEAICSVVVLGLVVVIISSTSGTSEEGKAVGPSDVISVLGSSTSSLIGIGVVVGASDTSGKCSFSVEEVTGSFDVVSPDSVVLELQFMASVITSASSFTSIFGGKKVDVDVTGNSVVICSGSITSGFSEASDEDSTSG